jgi:4-amino-4-deoxy-L-arabinose transferase-like glycosyltransferase
MDAARNRRMTSRFWYAGLLLVLIVYLHNTVPYLTTMPRVNVDEPWLMERAYQVMRTGIPSQPMLGLNHAYLLQVGYGYLAAIWMTLFGVGILQARLLGVCLGLGIVLMVASIGRRSAGAAVGLAAALFLSLDSNFLGGVRNARTDIPSVFFVVGMFAAYLRGWRLARWPWFMAAGASLGVAMLMHGNAFWAGLIVLAWFLLDYRLRALTVPFGYAVVAGWLVTFGPYLAMVVARWSEVQQQIANFAADRVPGWQPSFLMHQAAREVERYRGWYFGLVTATVPNPLLWAFQLAIVLGIVVLALRAFGAMRRGDAWADANGAARLLMLSAGAAVIFAGFINNKALVYLPHLMIGFALAAGAAVSEALSLFNPARRQALALLFVAGYGAVGIAYYEKWYSTASKSELVSYESTEATLRALVPSGPKYVYASPQFWTPYHAEPGVSFFSYAAAHPVADESAVTLAGAADDRPIVLIVDELQWLQELVGVSSSTAEWQRTWIDFIEHRCSLDAVAYGTAHGTLGAYRCSLSGAGQATATTPRIIGGSTEFRPADVVLDDDAAALAGWPRYEDPRRTAEAKPQVHSSPEGLRISGTGWPGIVKMVPVAPGQAYLVTAGTEQTRDGDLLYLGTWESPQVLSLSGASAAGIPAPLLTPRWFPRDRAFRATAPSVRVLVYSEAPSTDFVISSLRIQRLEPVPAHR